MEAWCCLSTNTGDKLTDNIKTATSSTRFVLHEKDVDSDPLTTCSEIFLGDNRNLFLAHANSQCLLHGFRLFCGHTCCDSKWSTQAKRKDTERRKTRWTGRDYGHVYVCCLGRHVPLKHRVFWLLYPWAGKGNITLQVRPCSSMPP